MPGHLLEDLLSLSPDEKALAIPSEHRGFPNHPQARIQLSEKVGRSISIRIASALLTTGPRRQFMDANHFTDAIATINNFSTVASIVCVLPTYFLRLEPTTYRIVLSVGIVFGLSTLAFAMTTIFWPLPHQYSRDDAIFPVVVFSPLVVVLIAILARIKRATRVGLWSTVVLACVIVDWAGISWLMLVVQP